MPRAGLLSRDPTVLFATVVKGLADAGLGASGRFVIEKPFGDDLESAWRLARELHASSHPNAPMFVG